MRESGFAEWLLRWAAGHDGGTAMYGDLTEMAATRGNTWFWWAYARTLVALTWRTVAGFALGLAVVAIVSKLQFGEVWQRFVFFHFRYRWRWIPDGREGLPIYNFLYRALYSANVTGCLLTSYAAVRYGVRDKMVRAAFAVGLMLTSAMALAREWPATVSLITLAVVTTACALMVSEWRGAFASVAASLAAGTAAADCLFSTQRVVLMHFVQHGLPMLRHRWFGFVPEFWAILILNMALIAAISTRLHERFVSEKRVAST